MPTTQPLELAWTAPGGANADLRVFVLLDLDNGAASRKAHIRCAYPASQGQGTISATLLADVKSRLGDGVLGIAFVLAGGQTEVAAGGASYWIVATRPGDSTDLFPFPVVLQ